MKFVEYVFEAYMYNVYINLLSTSSTCKNYIPIRDIIFIIIIIFWLKIRDIIGQPKYFEMTRTHQKL